MIDDFVPSGSLKHLLTIIDEEPVERRESDLFAFDATASEPTISELRALRDDFAATLAPALTRITAKPVTRVDMRAYAYRPGDFLLPHSDHQDGLHRVLAYAYYLPSPEPPAGGELELFRCDVENSAIVTTTSALVIEPRANRLVVFDVSDISLHQVREVIGGLRISLAGWFFQ